MIRKEVIGEAVLWNGDAAEVLPMLHAVDALVTDPPYGIGMDRALHREGGTRYGVTEARRRVYDDTNWDTDTVPVDLLEACRRTATWQVIFGGNYYALPPTSCWLVWDKLNGDNRFADCELAWTNLPKAVRRLRFMWNGMIRAHSEPRGDHPTQKPIGVMKWAIGHLPEPSTTILDPFAGSGTTGVAAIQMARKFIGIERDPKYFDIMCRRIEEAAKQPDLLYGPQPIDEEPLQLSLIGEGC